MSESDDDFVIALAAAVVARRKQRIEIINMSSSILLPIVIDFTDLKYAKYKSRSSDKNIWKLLNSRLIVMLFILPLTFNDFNDTFIIAHKIFNTKDIKVNRVRWLTATADARTYS